MTNKILVIGACGQIGTELTLQLRKKYGKNTVIASDIKEGNKELMQSGPFEFLDATDKKSIEQIIDKYQIEQVYLMAAMLSVVAEKYPEKAWDLNMSSLFHILNLAKDKKIKKVFWPSSIAVFGNSTPKDKTPQKTITEPTTVYGISKISGERWCAYYHNKFEVDIKSVRYPGIISWKTIPGGGTTDYAVEIFYEAIKNNHYNCFLNENTKLPMMYVDDAIKATIDLMETDRMDSFDSYNIAATNFTPKELADAIQKEIPDFTIEYNPDFRQKIADSWPNSIDDSKARKDWNWKSGFNLEKITSKMIKNLKNKLDIELEKID
jgi:nucleoside-diphosphate-sugar epimerase